MKRVTLLLVFLLVWGSCQVNLVPLISSRVDGTVLDKETRQPIAGAKVELIIGPGTGVSMELSRETVTNAKGYFRFDLSFKVPVTAYFKCEKEGYIPLIPEYYLMHAKEELFDKVVNLFEIHQGKIKRSIITLEKGGTLKGKVFKRDANGISPFSNLRGLLLRSTNPDANLLLDESYYIIAHTGTDTNGEFEIKGIEPYNAYYLKFSPIGYPREEIRGISISQNENPVLEYIIDLTNQTGIKGTVFLGQKPVDLGEITIRNMSKKVLENKDIGLYIFNKDGTYQFFGVNSGRYEVVVNDSDLGKSYEKRLEVDIVQGETKVLNITLGPEDIKEDSE